MTATSKSWFSFDFTLAAAYPFYSHPAFDPIKAYDRDQLKTVFADPSFRNQRAALLQSVEAKVATLPPESRAKVTASLTAIHDSMKVLEEELGKDPTNALLQELLLNTYQDEMRVLTTVHEASDAGKGI